MIVLLDHGTSYRSWTFNWQFLFIVVQAEKDAKKKARAKELKKLRKAKEKAKACYLLILAFMEAPLGLTMVH